MPEPKTILLVEDDAMIAIGEQFHLQKEGYRVLLAGNGETAVDMVCGQNLPVDLILMDINLGSGMDGTQAARQILLTNDIPIVFLSSHTEKEIVEKTEQITSYGYIVKNSGPMVLFASIKMAFKLYKSHRELRESEDRYRTVVENSPNSILILSEGKIVYVNAAAVQLLHAKGAQDLEGLPFVELVHPDHPHAARAAKRRPFNEAGLPPLSVEKKIVTRDGQLIDVEVITTPILFDGSSCVLVMIHNITSRIQAEELSRQSQARVQAMFKAIPDQMFQVDRQGAILSFKPDSRDPHVQSGPLTGKRNHEITPPEFTGILREKIRAALETGALQTFEYQRPYPDHGAREYEARIAGSGPDEVTAIIRDITERKHADAALQASEKKYRELFDNAPLAISQTTLEGQVISVNTRFARMFGYASPEEFYTIVENYVEIYANPEARQQIIRLRTQNPDISTFENLYRRKDGSTFWGRLHVRNLASVDGRTQLSEGFIEDVSERKTAEAEPRDREVKFRALFEQTHDGVFIDDLQGRCVKANQRAADMLGYPIEELLGLHLSALSAQPEQSLALLERLRAGEIIAPYERLLRKKDGQVFPVEVNAELIRDGDGRPLHILSLARDISQRRQAEAEILNLLAEKQLAESSTRHPILAASD